MKILNIFNHYLEHGGEAVAVEAICSSLAKFTEVELCEFQSAEWLEQDAPSRMSQALRMFHNPDAARRLRMAQARKQSDFWLVHNVFPVASGAVYSEARRLDVPLVQYVHNFRPFSVSGYLWANQRPAIGGLSKNYWSEISAGAWQNSRAKTAWLAGVLLAGHALGWWRSVKAWIAISDFMRTSFISAGVPADKIFTLRHFWRCSVEDNQILGSHYLFLGRLVEAKGINVLLDAWQTLEEKCGDSTLPTLVICGDGPLRPAVAARATRLNHVEVRGQVSGHEKRELLRNSKAVIVPSISWEALGLTVYEAFDFSRPVLVAKSGGLPELVMDGIAGRIHEAGGANQLAEHVLEMEKNVEGRREMGRQGRSWLLRNADEQAWQRRFLEIANYVSGSGIAPRGHQQAR